MTRHRCAAFALALLLCSCGRKEGAPPQPTPAPTAAQQPTIIPTPVDDPVGLAGLDAPADARASDHVPDVTILPIRPAEIAVHPGRRMKIVRTRLTVRFAKDATVAQANDLIRGVGGRIVGAISSLRLVVIGLQDRGGFASLDAALERVRKNPLVCWHAVDPVLVPDTVPAPSGVTAQWPFPGGGTHGWTWGAGLSGTYSWDSGSWGLEMIRAPQAWNLIDHGRRQHAETGSFPRVAVIDGGFNAHPDLPGLSLWERGAWRSETLFAEDHAGCDASHPDVNHSCNPCHGTHVAGIIAAAHPNGAGVCGVFPFMLNAPQGSLIGVVEDGDALSHAVQDLEAMLKKWPDLKAINVSMGTGIEDVNPDRLPDDTAAEIKSWAGQVRKLLKGRETVVCCSAGNRGDDFPGQPEPHAMFNSSFACAALYPKPLYDGEELHDPSENILVVESADPDFLKAGMSQVGGHVSGPGHGAMSSVGGKRWGFKFGTSQATPYVTGLVATLFMLNPSLRAREVVKIVKDPANTREVKLRGGDAMPPSVPEPARMIDAFAAVMAIDKGRPLRPIQRALCDLDDGTRDGNLRRRAFPDDPDPDTIHTRDQRRGSDGVIDMRDFRVLRDAFLAAMTAGPDREKIVLDGMATHFKKDLNGDGVVDRRKAYPPDACADHPSPSDNLLTAPDESVYPRADLNGDGVLVHRTTPFKGTPKTDMEVMADLWNPDNEERVTLAGDDDTEPGRGEWTQTSLLRDRDDDKTLDYLLSCDLHIRLPQSGAKVDRIVVYSYKVDAKPEREAYDWGELIAPSDLCRKWYMFMKGMRNPKAGTYEVTVPLYPGDDLVGRAEVVCRLKTETAFKELHLHFAPRPGEDLALEIDWGRLDFRSVAREKDARIFPPESQIQVWHNKFAADEEHPEPGDPLFATGELADEGAVVARLKQAYRDLTAKTELGGWMKSFGSAPVSVWPWADDQHVRYLGFGGFNGRFFPLDEIRRHEEDRASGAIFTIIVGRDWKWRPK